MHPPSAKLMLRVYGYTNTRHLFGQEFLTRFVQKSAPDDLEACDLYDVLAHLGYGPGPQDPPTACDGLCLQTRSLAGQHAQQKRRDSA